MYRAGSQKGQNAFSGLLNTSVSGQRAAKRLSQGF